MALDREGVRYSMRIRSPTQVKSTTGLARRPTHFESSTEPIYQAPRHVPCSLEWPDITMSAEAQRYLAVYLMQTLG